MPTFKTLFITEFVEDSDKTDTQMFILYDPACETFFYYGTRKSNLTDKHVTYEGKFPYSRIYAFASMLEFVLNNLNDPITVELHDVYIPESEYDDLDFHRLRQHISKYSEIAAYDKKRFSHNDMVTMLDMIVTNEL